MAIQTPDLAWSRPSVEFVSKDEQGRGAHCSVSVAANKTSLSGQSPALESIDPENKVLKGGVSWG